MSTTVVEALSDIAEQLRLLAEQCAGSAPSNGGDSGDIDDLQVYKDAVLDSREEILIRYTVGDLEFVTTDNEFGQPTRYGLLDMKMFKMDGSEDGSHQTVWIPITSKASDLMTVAPPSFTGPFDTPSAIYPVAPRAHSKAVWTFADGSSIFATGPANLLLVPYKDGAKQFVVSVAAVITGGTGIYEGCRGVKTALGSSVVPKDVVDLSAIPDGTKIRGVTVETFRLIRKKSIAR